MAIGKKIKIILLTILLSFSSVSFAEGSLCDTTVNTLLTSSSLDLEKLMKNEEAKNCLKTKALFSLPTKIIYLIFGEVTLDIMENIIVTDKIHSEMDDYKEELRSDASVLNIKVVFTAITTIMFILASLVITYQTLLVLYESSKSGEFLGKGTNTTWTLIKLTMGATLLFPVEEFGGYSFAQVIVIASGVFATLLAGVLWFILFIVMNFLFISNYDQMSTEATDYFNVDSITIVNNAISTEICDLERRTFFLEKDATNGKVSLTDYNNNEFNKCLNEVEEVSKDIKGISTLKISPQRHSITNICINDVYNIKYKSSCGGTEISSQGNIDHTTNKLETISTRARNIASKLINLNCINKNILENYGKPYQYGYICAELSEGDFVFNADKIKYVNKDQDYAEYKNSIDNDIKSFVQELNIMAKTEKDNRVKEILEENKSNGLGHLYNGWFSASHYLMDVSNNYKEVQRAAREVWNGDFIQYNGDNEYFLEQMKIEEESHVLRKFHNYTEETIEKMRGEDSLFYTVDSADKVISALDKIQNKFFSGFYGLNTFLGIEKGTIAGELQKDDNCFNNFKNCSVVVANPLFEYVKMGNDMIEISSGIILVLAGMDLVNEKMTDNPNNISGFKGGINFVLNFLINIIKIYFIIGLLIVYITPIIPFLYFLSYIISWIILIVEGVVTAQIWAFLHLTISKEEGLSNNVKSGYNLIFTIILKPIVLIISMVLSLVATSMAVGIFNVLFGLILSILPIAENPNSIVAFAFNVFAYTIYAILLTIVILRVTKIIFEIPNKVSQMLKLTQMHGGTGQDWTEVMGRLTAITNGKLFRMLRL